jgi:hypothetical protein
VLVDLAPARQSQKTAFLDQADIADPGRNEF